MHFLVLSFRLVYTVRIRNTYCFCTTGVVAGTRLNVTLAFCANLSTSMSFNMINTIIHQYGGRLILYHLNCRYPRLCFFAYKYFLFLNYKPRGRRDRGHPQETMAMRRCRNRSNDLIHGGR